MKNKFILIIFTILLISSCEKKIELHPENGEEKIVVEAIFTQFPSIPGFTSPNIMKLTKTKGLYEDILNHPKITDADVKIIDLTTNETINFTSNNDGTYSSNTTGIQGHKYKLEINADGQHITAEQTMLPIVSILDIKSHKKESGSNDYYLNVKFDDNPNTTDYYLFICYPVTDENGNPIPESEVIAKIMVRSDLLYNNITKSVDLKEESFKKGESWLMFLFHIDRDNYEYLKIMNRAKNSLLNGVHPFYGLSLGNPKSTVYGTNAMGYFVASPVGFTLSPIIIGD